MNTHNMPRPSLDDMAYFSYLNFAAAHKSPLRNLRYLGFDDKDMQVLKLLKKYTTGKPNNGHIQGNDNLAVCATVIYQNMINKAGAIMYVPQEELIPYENPDKLLELIIDYNLVDDEVSAGIGGVWGENIAMEYATAHNQVDSKYNISSHKLLDLFLPIDFSDINCENQRSKRGARNLGVVSAALLGPIEGAEYAEVLAIKQSVYGMWGKTFRVRAKVNERGYPIYYSIDEIIFVTGKQIKKLYDVDSTQILEQAEKEDLVLSIHKEPVYIVQRTYGLKMPDGDPAEYRRDDLLQSKLLLADAKIVHPRDIFDYVHDRRQFSRMSVQ